jgi:hypothetical protein
MSYEEDRARDPGPVSYEEEDTCMSYEEEDTCMSYEEDRARDPGPDDQKKYSQRSVPRYLLYKSLYRGILRNSCLA